MSRSDENQHPTSNDAEALNAYLDQLTGANGEPAGDLSPELRQAVNRLFALATVAGPLDDIHMTKEPSMTTTVASPLTLDPSAHLPRITMRPAMRSPSVRRLIGRVSRPIQVAATAAVVLLTVVAAFGAFRTMNQSDGNGEGFYAAVPVATVPDDAVTSSVPYPTAEECTATPRTREEVAAIQRKPLDNARFGIPAELGDSPDEATAKEVLATYRQWQACQTKGLYYWLSADLVTDDNVFYLLNDGPFFSTTPESQSGEEIAETLDTWEEIHPEAREPGGTPEAGIVPTASPVARDVSPISALTIFPEDLTIYAPPPSDPRRPTLVHAIAYWVEYETNQIVIETPVNVLFSESNGRWLVAGTWTVSRA